MKLRNNILSISCMAAVILTGCEKEFGRTVYPESSPELSNLTLSVGTQMETADTLSFSVNIKDSLTPLSTLEVLVTASDDTIYSESIRTEGYEASINEHKIYLPFTVNQQDNQDARIALTAINVEGSEQTLKHSFKLMRPNIPSTIYLHYDDNVIPMVQDATNPYLYATEIGEYPNEFSGKISTSEDLSQSKLIWGYSETSNDAELISETGAGFSFSYPDWDVEQVTFNTLTFTYGANGTYQKVMINGTELEVTGTYYYGSFDFEQGSTVEVLGIENLEGAYNRDFFTYDSESQTLTFIRDSGTWEVYYYAAYNYLWVVRTEDTAPDAFWLAGHGFTSASVWNEDYAFGGWSLEDISRLGYIVKIGDKQYQTTVYLNNAHEWETFEVEIYSDREGNKTYGMELQEGSFTGDTTGFTVSESDGFTSTDEFVPGYYRLTFDTSAGVGSETMNIERISD